MFLCYFMFFFCFFMLVYYNVHYLSVLLLLEAILLSVFLYLSTFFLSVHGLLGLFVYLLLVVCMGGFSVSLLVSISRFFGRDFWYFRFVF